MGNTWVLTSRPPSHGLRAWLHAINRDGKKVEQELEKELTILRICVGENHPKYHTATEELRKLMALARSEVTFDEV